MGLTEANQILTLNNLRHNVTLRTDGGLKNWKRRSDSSNDGCRRIWYGDILFSCNGLYNGRQCHSNTCPVGVCSQDPSLREKFTGTPEKLSIYLNL